MLDLTVVILTYNEERHIQRCLENVLLLTNKIYVVDCFSTDKTQEIAESLGAHVVCHEWPGNQADQFNWALDNLSIDTAWVLRLDADEYCSNALINEIKLKLPTLQGNCDAVILPLGREFMGKRLRYGITSQVKIIRLFRYGKARYEKRVMDEHLVLTNNGEIISFENPFYDASLLPMSEFVKKHNGYAVREAAILLESQYGDDTNHSNEIYGPSVAQKRKQKNLYARMPLFLRALMYFIYRYFIRLGFLDGKEGFIWDFMQGLWYRMLVDAHVYEISQKCHCDYQEIKSYLLSNYNMKL